MNSHRGVDASRYTAISEAVVRSTSKAEQEYCLFPYAGEPDVPYMVAPGEPWGALEFVNSLADAVQEARGAKYVIKGAKLSSQGLHEYLRYTVEKREEIYAMTQEVMRKYVNGVSQETLPDILKLKEGIALKVSREMAVFPSSKVGIVSRKAAVELQLIRETATQASQAGRMTDELRSAAAKSAAYVRVGLSDSKEILVISSKRAAKIEAAKAGFKYVGIAIDVIPPLAHLLTAKSDEQALKAFVDLLKMGGKEGLKYGLKKVAKTAGAGALEWCLVAFFGINPAGMAVVAIGIGLMLVGEFVLGEISKHSADWIFDTAATYVGLP